MIDIREKLEALKNWSDPRKTAGHLKRQVVGLSNDLYGHLPNYPKHPGAGLPPPPEGQEYYKRQSQGMGRRGGKYIDLRPRGPRSTVLDSVGLGEPVTGNESLAGDIKDLGQTAWDHPGGPLFGASKVAVDAFTAPGAGPFLAAPFVPKLKLRTLNQPGMRALRSAKDIVGNTFMGKNLAYPHMPHLTPKTARRLLSNTGSYRLHGTELSNIPKIQQGGFRGGDKWGVTTTATSLANIIKNKKALSGDWGYYGKSRGNAGIIFKRHPADRGTSGDLLPINADRPGGKGHLEPRATRAPPENIAGYVTWDNKPIPQVKRPWFARKPKKPWHPKDAFVDPLDFPSPSKSTAPLLPTKKEWNPPPPPPGEQIVL